MTRMITHHAPPFHDNGHHLTDIYKTRRHNKHSVVIKFITSGRYHLIHEPTGFPIHVIPTTTDNSETRH